jgi:hypothetical protein
MPDTDSRLNLNRMVVNPVPRPYYLPNHVGVGESDESKATGNLEGRV